MKRVKSVLLLAAAFIVFITAAAQRPIAAESKTVDFSGVKIGNARQLTTSDIVGAVLSFSADVQKISIACACWKNEDASFTYTIYPFEEDYDTSVQKEPVKTGTITYNTDGFQDIEWTEEEPLAKGVYVLEITNAGENGVQTGIRYDGEYEGQYVYENGIYTPDNSLRLQVVYTTSPEADYGELQKPETGQDESDPAPGAVMFFSDDEADTHFNESGNLIAPELQDGILRLNITAGSDPNIYIFASEDASTLLAEEYPVLLFKVRRSEGSPLTGQFFFNTVNFTGPSAAGAVSFAYEDTTDWQMIAVNLGNNTNYTGEIISYRYDPFSATEADCTIEIEWIAFFRSTAAAKAFNGDFTQFENEETPAPSSAEPETPAPTAAATPSATAGSATARATQAPSESDGGLSQTAIIVIVCVAAVIVIAVVVVIIIKKKR